MQLDDKQRRSIAIKRFLACMPVHPSTMAASFLLADVDCRLRTWCVQLEDKMRRSIAIKRFLACMPVHPSTMAASFLLADANCTLRTWCVQLDDKMRRSIAIKRFLACMPVHPSTMAANPHLWALDAQRKGLIASGVHAAHKRAGFCARVQQTLL